MVQMHHCLAETNKTLNVNHIGEGGKKNKTLELIKTEVFLDGRESFKVLKSLMGSILFDVPDCTRGVCVRIVLL